MSLPNTEMYTVEDIYNLPDKKRAELIDGKIYYMMPTSSRTHQMISGELFATIHSYIKANKGECKVFAAPFSVFINEDNYNYVEPDISVICDLNKLDDRGCNGAPDWIIEVVSIESRRRDYSTKLFKYQESGVREYWIVDPAKDRITVWDFENNDSEEYCFKDKVKAGIYPDLYIDFSEIEL